MAFFVYMIEQNVREQNGKGETQTAEWKWECDQGEEENQPRGERATHILNETQQEEEGESGG